VNNSSFNFIPDQASTVAPSVDMLTMYILLVSVFFTVLIATLIIFFAIKYRRRRGMRKPEAVHTNMLLEVAWIAIPLMLVSVMFVWGTRVYVTMARPPANAMEIFVMGKQWMWKIQHPEGRREINELHIPLGKPVKLTMISQDVIHDFFVPAFRVKKDVLPGRYTSEWFTATKVGQYHLFCSQYCGAQHSGMVGTVYVMDPAEYQQWLVGTTLGEPPADAGAKLFYSYGCMACHSSQAPTMAGLYLSQVRLSDGKTVVADDEYLRESILEPHAKIVAGYPDGLMPTFTGRINDEQMMEIIAYIKSMKDAQQLPAGMTQPQPGAPVQPR
jgi:cytochrome c oxidase subunit II